jgi:hypothetical protein
MLDTACLGESARGGEDGNAGYLILDSGYLMLDDANKKAVYFLKRKDSF